MSKKPETLLKEKVIRRLKSLGNCHIMKVQQTSIRGDPDLALCVNGWSVYVELKKDRKQKADKLQQFKLASHEASNGYSFILHDENIEEILGFIKKLSIKNHVKRLEI